MTYIINPFTGKLDNIGTPVTPLTTPISIANGGTNNSSFTSGSVLFFDGTRINEANSVLYFDPSTLQFALGTNSFSSLERMRVLGKPITINNPTSGMGSINYGQSSGYLTSSRTIDYKILGRKVVNGSTVYSSIPATASITDDGRTLSGPGTPNFGSATINYAGSGYIADGKTIAYSLYGYIDRTQGRAYAATPATTSVMDDNSSNAYQVDLSWSGAGGETGYYLIRQINGGSLEFIDIGNFTSFSDQNSGWASGSNPTPTSVADYYNIDVSWSDPGSLDGFVVLRSINSGPYDYYRDTGVSISFTDSNTGWTTPAIDVSNTTYQGVSIRAEGEVDILGPLSVIGNVSGTTYTGAWAGNAILVSQLNSTSVFSYTSSGTNIKVISLATTDVGFGIVKKTSQSVNLFNIYDTNGSTVFLGINSSGQLATLAGLADGLGIVLGSSSGNKWGTATSQKQAWWNATPVVQPANTAAIDAILTTLGLRASGGVGNFDTTITTRQGGTGAGTQPFQFATSSALNTTAAARSLEFSGTNLYFTHSGAMRFGIGGKVADFVTNVGNSTTTETDGYSFTIPANGLTADNSNLLFWASINVIGSATATSQFKIYFAASSIFDTGALSLASSGNWQLNINYVRVSVNTGRISYSLQTPGASLAVYSGESDLTGLDYTATQVIKFTMTRGGVGAASNDITAKHGYINYFAPANL